MADEQFNVFFYFGQLRTLFPKKMN